MWRIINNIFKPSVVILIIVMNFYYVIPITLEFLYVLCVKLYKIVPNNVIILWYNDYIHNEIKMKNF